MPKQISETELRDIKQAVSRFPDGASLEQVLAALNFDIHRRALQRRLALLIKRQELIKEGSGKSTRYKSPYLIKASLKTPKLTLESFAESYVPISRAGEQVKQAVRSPMQQRQPVGYNRTLLDSYIPNTTFYLPESTRYHLLAIGGQRTEVLPAGTYALKIYHRLLIDLTWNSSRLEGNTYTLLETENLIAAGEIAEGRSAFESQMILNHKSAIELLVDSASEVGFNRYTFCNLHALLSENLLPDPAACGRLREQAVGIGGSVFLPLDGGPQLQELFDMLLAKAAEIDDPFEQSFFTMVHVPYLQPFDDVNKRVSRLAANIPLIRENLCPLSFIDVPQQAYIDGLMGVYELNRTELLEDVFVWAYERSCARYSAARQSLGEPDPFRLRYRDAIAELISSVVTTPMNKKDAISSIREYADSALTEQDKRRFVEMVELELMSLHEGNIARYRIRPAAFERWREYWK